MTRAWTGEVWVRSTRLAVCPSAAPTLADGDLVVLEDPKGLFLSSNVVPIVSERVNDKTAETLNQVSRALTVEDLIAMNKRSVDDKESASAIAADWLKSKGLA